MKNVSAELSLAVKVGGYLKKELTKRGLTYWDFSGIIGYSDKQVGRWCREGVYSVKAIEDIASALQVSYKDIIAASDDDDVPLYVSFFDLTYFFYGV